MDNHHTPPHVDASKDPAAVRSTLATMRRQYADIMIAYGVDPIRCQQWLEVAEESTEFMLSEVERRND